MAYQSTSYLLPQVDGVTHRNAALPPMCPSRKSFTVAPIRNHPILKDYLHSPSKNGIPGPARPLPTRYTKQDPKPYGDEVILDPYWHAARMSSNWNARNDRATASASPKRDLFPNLCNRFNDGLIGRRQFRNAPHDLSRVNGSLLNNEPRGLLPSGFKTPNRSRASSFDQHSQDLSDESDILEESRDFEPEGAHVDDLNQHSSPSDDLTRHHYRSNEDIRELEDGEGVEAGDGKGDSGYSSHDEPADNSRQEPAEDTNPQASTSRSSAKENANPVQESMEAGPSVKKPCPPVDEIPLQKILSTFRTKSLHVMSDRICYDSKHDKPLKARVRLTTKRPLTEASGQDFSKKMKILLSHDKKQ
ncbi:uncharacterized protein MELLADRAFT_90330 [Melampsora larici-populina 98AG31]|uniref:Uncharacterized protein n=1 Tax=Melampsora larici-populina (strain 98AG31 / pathotype 3-4-7) TaxID=747676 RepID=F4RWJ8_MELLP|nr:uncharacterized protein MELLADRAFT_90330 [Melampsora larici-populina 98AG31]EGG03306.1 hypothetical protein MELLADRAFT_90330 [Melampsora larici-populina 98AG31]